MKFSKAIILFLILVFCTHFTHAEQVQVFTKYDTHYEIFANGTLNIKKDLTIKNTHTLGIIPGKMEFQIGNENHDFQIAFVRAYDQFNNTLRSKFERIDNFTKLDVYVEYPILPGFEYNFKVDYILKYDPTGIFFKTLEIPKDDSSIKIEQKNIKIDLPDGYTLTFTNENYSQGGEKNEIILSDVNNNLTRPILIEYSYLPIKVQGFRGLYIFWTAIIVVLLTIFILLVRKTIRESLLDEDDEEINENNSQSQEIQQPITTQENHNHYHEEYFEDDDEEYIDENLFK